MSDFYNTSVEGNVFSPLYAQFHDSGANPCFIVPAIALNLVSVPGILMNASIIHVTRRYKSLRSTSSFLLALTAFYDILHAFGHLLFLGVALSGANFVDYGLAFKFLLVPLVGECSGVTAMALTGLDRLLQVTWPKRHESFNRRAYLHVMVILSLVPSAASVCEYARMAAQFPALPTTGLINDIFLLDFHTVYYVFMFTANTLTIAFYAVIWLFVRHKTANIPKNMSAESKTNSRLFKSLVCIICINISGYYATSILNIVDGFIQGSVVELWLVESGFAVLLNLGIASTAPVLFFTSTDYRQCFAMEMCAFLQKVCGLSPINTSNQVAPIGTNDEPRLGKNWPGNAPSAEVAGAGPMVRLSAGTKLPPVGLTCDQILKRRMDNTIKLFCKFSILNKIN